MTQSVLIVDDEPLVREALAQTLELAGYDTVQASAFIVAKDHISAEFPGVVLSDIRMPGKDGLFLLDYAHRVDSDLPVILLTGDGDIPTAVGAINKGAFDFLEKPCSNEVLLDRVGRAMRARWLVLENRRLNAELNKGDVAARLIYGVSDKAEALRRQIRRVAGVADGVVVEGPPGVGIAKVADVIHQLSPRAPGRYLRISGAGLTVERLAQHLSEAATGTLFIEEAPAMPGAAQFALLEHLDRMGPARVVAGVTEGGAALIPELHYRLEALRVRVPALAERSEDIPVIFRHYVAEAAAQSQIAPPDVTPAVIAELMARDWLGNTRALRSAAMRFVLGLEAPLEGEATGLAEKMTQVERALIIDALVQQKGHASATAQVLKLPRKTFYDKLSKHGIKPEDFR